MRRIFKILFLFFLITCPLTLSSQEIVTGLIENAVARKYYSELHYSKKASIPADTVELPFIDDFSDSDVEPKPTLWTDRYAFVNSTYAISPPTVGVVTLDALNYDGSQYTNAKITTYQADYLTSQPINLDYSVSDSICLSFYYQAGGLAEPPEPGDSLVLDFFSADSLSWHKVWGVPGIVSSADNQLKPEFKPVILKIENPVFLKKGFRFRFRNYASQFANADNADKRANVDLWHIDYVKLDRNRRLSDTVLRDVVFMEPIKSILKEYSSIPWSHFGTAYNTQRAPFIEVIINNYDTISRNVGTLLEIKDLFNSTPVYKIPVLNNNILAGDSILYKYSYNYPFEFSAADSAAFEIKTILQTDPVDYKPNDTLRYVQKFFDYYALDDGTAEAGYGLRGSSTKDASVAIKFNAFEGDSISAIDIYFTQLIDSLNLDFYFYLNVWADNRGIPGTSLLNQVGMRPEYSDKLNTFVRYQLDFPVFVKGTFYIGFTNTVERLINIGFDRNRPNQSKIFHNSDNGIWKNTTLAGTPMMRPVFQKSIPLGNKQLNTPGLRVWPNPADDFLYFSPEEPFQYSVSGRIELIDITGRTIKSIIPADDCSMSTGELQNGIYILRYTDPYMKISSTKKIIIRH